MPRFSDDDVLDFMVTEAVVAAGRVEMAEAEHKQAKTREVAAWKNEIKPSPAGG